MSTRTSHADYREFAANYRRRLLDEIAKQAGPPAGPGGAKTLGAKPGRGLLRGKRRDYLRPHDVRDRASPVDGAAADGGAA